MLSNVLIFLIINAIFLGIAVSAIYFFRNYDSTNAKRDFGYEIKRKLFHIIICSAFLLCAYTLPQQYFIVVSLEFIIGLYIIGKLNPPNIIKEALDIKRNAGIYFLGFGILVCTLFFYTPLNFLKEAILIVLVADSFAAIIGQRLNFFIYHPRGISNKSIGGTLVFLVITIIILLLFGAPLITAVIVGILLTFLENLSINGSDNLILLIATPLFLSIFLYQSIILCIL